MENISHLLSALRLQSFYEVPEWLNVQGLFEQNQDFEQYLRLKLLYISKDQ